MAQNSKLNSRRVTCPCCNASFNPGKVKKTWRSFACPECSKVLKYETPTFAYVLFFACLYGVPALMYYFGFRDMTLVPRSIAVGFVIFFLGLAIYSLIFPSKAQQKLNYGESGLHLTDKDESREGQRPTDD
jgi:hypothetical protein